MLLSAIDIFALLFYEKTRHFLAQLFNTQKRPFLQMCYARLSPEFSFYAIGPVSTALSLTQLTDFLVSPWFMRCRKGTSRRSFP